MSRSGLLLPALLCAMAPVVLSAQSDVPTGLIDGRVRSGPTQQPIGGATIRVAGTDFAVVSGEDGRFLLRAPAGVVRLEIRAIGFAPVVRSDVVVSAGKPSTVVVDLQPRVVRLATVEVAPTYSTTRLSPRSARSD